MKPGIKTTEFWIAVGVKLFAMITLLLLWTGVLQNVTHPEVIEVACLAVLGLSAGGYAISRGLSKALHDGTV